MQNSPPDYSFEFIRPALIGALIFIAGLQTALAEVSTLFTTQQERQIIDRNRYKNEPVQQPAEPEVDQAPVEAINELVREEVNKSYEISGISISNDGTHTAWINGQVVEDNELIDGKSRLKVLSGENVKVRITAPDGKHYFGTSGETVEVSYLEAVES